jgi:hypothetical protein
MTPLDGSTVRLCACASIHLATALLWREANEYALTVATHDAQLGRAARAMGLETVGV